MSVVRYDREGSVAVLTINNPPVNSLAVPVRTALDACLDRASADDAVRAVVIIGAGRTFVSGAEIREFGTPKARVEPLLTMIQRRIEAFPKLVVAAIHGTAFGGGFELALACHARVATADARFGLPEVNLGLMPGAGGGQRLLRLVGPAMALDLITTGKSFSGEDGVRLGVIDALVEDLREGAVQFADISVREGRRFLPIMERAERLSEGSAALFADFRARLAADAPDRLAPFAIVDAIEAGCSLGGAQALAYEKQRSMELKDTDQHRALKRHFFIERAARKIPDVPETTKSRPIGQVAVIGAGTMGTGIAVALANSGLGVTLLDRDAKALASGQKAIEDDYVRLVSKGTLGPAAMEAALSCIRGVHDYDSLGAIDLAIEAVSERLDLKREVFGCLDRATAPHVILATTTSWLDIDAIAAATSRPDKVVGTHFLAPAPEARLLENVRGSKTSAETIAAVMALGRTLGKATALARNCAGFIGNRMLQYYTGQAEFLLELGAAPEQVDRVAVALGMPIGPLALRDMAGMDADLAGRQASRVTLSPQDRLSEIPDRLIAAGRLGRGSGAGYYRYEGQHRFADPVALDIFAQVARERGIARRDFSDAEIRDRLFFPVVNEGAKVLEDGTALRAGDIDVIWINGYGFPAYRGGPMFWGELSGLSQVRDLANRLADEFGPRWAPSDLLCDLARTGRSWDDLPVAAPAPAMADMLPARH